MTEDSGDRGDGDAGHGELDIEAFQSGDLDSLRQVLERFSPLIESVAASYAREGADREDLFQLVCVRVWDRRKQYTGRGSFGGWVNRVAHSVCSNWADQQKSRRKHEARYVSEVVSMNGAHDPGDPAEHVVQGEFLGRLRRCLARLPKRQGDTFLLIHLEGHTTAEVARIQGVRAATVRSNLRHANQRLRIMMEDYRE